MKKGKSKSRGNGQGTAILAPNKKSWIAIVTVGKSLHNGVYKLQRKKKSGFPTKKDALAYCMSYDRASLEQKPRLTLQEVYNQWEPFYSPRIDASTMVCYKSAYKHFSDIHGVYMDIITPENLQDCLDDCPSGKRTHQNMKCVAGLLWAYAVDHKIIDRDITRNLFIGHGESEQREPLTEEEVEIFKNEINNTRYAEYIYALCYLGFRPGELLELKKSDFHIQIKNGKTIYYFIAGKKTQAGRNRIVVIPNQILDIIIERLWIPGTDLLFPQYVFSRKKPYDFIEFKEMSDAYLRDSVFKKIAAEHNIDSKKVPYCARHTYADKLDKAAGSDKNKAELIGHQSYEFTQSKYQSKDIDGLNEVVQSLE